MSSTTFNMCEFLFDKRMLTHDLANITDKTNAAIWYMRKRGTIKVSYLRTLESHFGDCSKYINKNTVPVNHAQLQA
jgi:hypothetical protein